MELFKRLITVQTQFPNHRPKPSNKYHQIPKSRRFRKSNCVWPSFKVALFLEKIAMKRRKNEAGNGPAMAAKRKAKGEVDRGKEVGKSTAEERGDEGEREGVAVEAERLMDWEEGTQRWSVVDEQMSWGSFWCPSWDIDEYLGEAYNDASYGDVVWDYDIWDLGGINEVP